MQRVGQEVRTETVLYQDVQYLRVSQDLLRGCLHLGLPGRPFELPYNTVSEALIERAVDLIRARYAGTVSPAAPGAPLAAPGHRRARSIRMRGTRACRSARMS